MGTIRFTGQEPFQLAVVQQPTADAEDDTVIVVLPVSVPGLPGSIAEIRVSLAILHAKKLAAQLLTATEKAERYSI
jgi:hypothetical protein